MGTRKNNIEKYQDLTPEKLHTHIRKNISIPKYMDMFLYENKISLSKFVQNAINIRIQETQFQSLKKQVEQNVNLVVEKRVKKEPNIQRVDQHQVLVKNIKRLRGNLGERKVKLTKIWLIQKIFLPL